MSRRINHIHFRTGLRSPGSGEPNAPGPFLLVPKKGQMAGSRDVQSEYISWNQRVMAVDHQESIRSYRVAVRVGAARLAPGRVSRNLTRGVDVKWKSFQALPSSFNLYPQPWGSLTRLASILLFIPYHLPAFHHELHALEFRDPAGRDQRIAGDGDQVGKTSPAIDRRNTVDQEPTPASETVFKVVGC